jgi:hypothetical protein
MTSDEAAPILELVSYAKEMLEKQDNGELFIKDGKSIVFYIYVQSDRNTLELQSLLVLLRKLVRGGGGTVELHRPDKADLRIRIDEKPPRDGIVWIEPVFILHCIDFNTLYDSARYVVAPKVKNAKIPVDAVSILKRRVEELLKRDERKEDLFKKENGESMKVFTCMKSIVVPELFHTAYDLRKLLWTLVRRNGGEITPLGWRGELFIRVEEEAPIIYREKEWVDSRYIVDCVEAGRLLDRGDYMLEVLVKEEEEEVVVKREREDDDDSLEMWRKRKKYQDE